VDHLASCPDAVRRDAFDALAGVLAAWGLCMYSDPMCAAVLLVCSFRC
jgi:hypothetical protein